uniref:Uncharacterized protein n=1 Tax=Glossina austeni TaxID=7395 RepID=A0A1A9VH54_GLOAU
MANLCCVSKNPRSKPATYSQSPAHVQACCDVHLMGLVKGCAPSKILLIRPENEKIDKSLLCTYPTTITATVTIVPCIGTVSIYFEIKQETIMRDMISQLKPLLAEFRTMMTLNGHIKYQYIT